MLVVRRPLGFRGYRAEPFVRRPLGLLSRKHITCTDVAVPSRLSGPSTYPGLPSLISYIYHDIRRFTPFYAVLCPTVPLFTDVHKTGDEGG